MSAKSDFLENQKLLNIFFEYLKSSDPKLDEDASDDVKNLFAIQKSSFILMLYNIIESTVSKLIQEIIDLVVSYSSSIDFKDFDIEIRKLWIMVQTQRFLGINKENKGNELANLYESLYLPTNWSTYKVFDDPKKIREVLGISGNLDFKKIKDIFKLFNIEIPSFQPDVNPKVVDSILKPKGYKPKILGKIKKMRNELAHGNVSFFKGADNETIDDLEECKDTTFVCLEILICSTTKYCNVLQMKLEEKCSNKQSVS